jgi:hypothetical protein
VCGVGVSSRVSSPAHTHTTIDACTLFKKADDRCRVSTGMEENTRFLQRCYKGVTNVLQGCFKNVTRVLQGCGTVGISRGTCEGLHDAVTELRHGQRQTHLLSKVVSECSYDDVVIQEQRAESREQSAERREQRAESREQRDLRPLRLSRFL